MPGSVPPPSATAAADTAPPPMAVSAPAHLLRVALLLDHRHPPRALDHDGGELLHAEPC
ncbi:hypothetical protein ACFY6U_11205 [Streptomyces sp. NPDC013157]|uniref:hypothetical protein n=1 Tax=Streptomyces sp. NPDC013157 TaxID=3364861 RepID=UPI0036B3BF51